MIAVTALYVNSSCVAFVYRLRKTERRLEASRIREEFLDIIAYLRKIVASEVPLARVCLRARELHARNAMRIKGKLQAVSA